MISAQVCPCLVVIKDHSKKLACITQHNATVIANFESICSPPSTKKCLDPPPTTKIFSAIFVPYDHIITKTDVGLIDSEINISDFSR